MPFLELLGSLGGLGNGNLGRVGGTEGSAEPSSSATADADSGADAGADAGADVVDEQGGVGIDEIIYKEIGGVELQLTGTELQN